MLLLGAILVIVVTLIELRVLHYAYEKIGLRVCSGRGSQRGRDPCLEGSRPRCDPLPEQTLSPRAASAVLILTLLGSFVNIPVARLPPERVVSEEVVEFYGIQYVVPSVEEWPGTVIAVNVGGALIPTLVSLYLLVKNRLYLRGLLGVVLVAVVVHQLAQPVKGMGIGVPMFVPPLLAVAVALILAWRQAAPLAYIAGSLGTLIGADLSNLDKIQGLGAPIASIGGAGTFDGVFLSGILAVLLTPFSRPITTAVEPGSHRAFELRSRATA
jgi:uncharacterized membrane protein